MYIQKGDEQSTIAQKAETQTNTFYSSRGQKDSVSLTTPRFSLAANMIRIWNT
jgi:hypothetical protein